MRCEAILGSAGIGHFRGIISRRLCVQLQQRCRCQCTSYQMQHVAEGITASAGTRVH